MLRLLVLLLLIASPVSAGVNRYQYRPKDSTGNPTAKIPQFLVADTQAELPSTDVREGDMAYTKDTNILWLRSDSAWILVASGGSNPVEVLLIIPSTASAGYFSVTVTGQSWMTVNSIITCTPKGVVSDGGTQELSTAAGFVVTTGNPVAGVGFDMGVLSPNGVTGTFRFSCLGI